MKAAIHELRSAIHRADMRAAATGDSPGDLDEVDRIRAALRALGEDGYIPLGRDPWLAIEQTAEALRNFYSPGDNDPNLGECSADLIWRNLDALRSAIAPDRADPAVQAVDGLLEALVDISQGLMGDLRDAAQIAHELGSLLGDLSGARR